MNIELKIMECKKYEKVEITIKCQEIDDRLTRLIKQIKQSEVRFTGQKNGSIYSIFATDLYYIESIDNKTFLYDHEGVYESDVKLYEVEDQTANTNFIRISKNMIVNTSWIESVRALINGRFAATLTNGEKVIVNRHYVKAFKSKFLL